MYEKIGRAFIFGAMLAGVAGMPPLAFADDVAPPRVAGLKAMGDAFKNVRDELKSDAPQVAVIQAAAQKISEASKAQYGWFPAGSGPAPGVKTAALPDIWERPADFKAAQDELATQAAAFLAAASTGDLEKIRAQVQPLGGACGNCHKQFRKKESL